MKLNTKPIITEMLDNLDRKCEHVNTFLFFLLKINLFYININKFLLRLFKI